MVGQNGWRVVTVVGAGGWGTAMALHLLLRPGRQVLLWCHDENAAKLLRTERVNHRQLPGVRLPDSLIITEDPRSLRESDVVFVAIPTIYLRSTILRLKDQLPDGVPVVSLTKGLEIQTGQRPSQILAEIWPRQPILALSGPSHAEEVARQRPTSVVLAGTDETLRVQIQQELTEPFFRVYTNPDLVGVELGGALKNVLGVAAGIGDGLGYGDNAKSALLTRGLVEMKRFSKAYGAEEKTLDGLAGLGDLITTCFSPHGRNRRVGEEIARDRTPLKILADRPQIAEGLFTARSLYELATKQGIDMPIATAVYRVLYEDCPPRQLVQQLLLRECREE